MSWMELPSEDQPPQSIWLDSEAISDHFEAVRQRYADKKGGGGDMSPVPQAPLEQNELTKGLR